jgi:hypothetical protein
VPHHPLPPPLPQTMGEGKTKQIVAALGPHPNPPPAGEGAEQNKSIGLGNLFRWLDDFLCKAR